ncbi:hypothetical protein HPC49_47220 [Pyxidicoccus fallax]|uniref:Lipoprotein n=1 Tax=Pyxidicoccus fallax TaxID=394095 RepID=A0A848LYA1_9BACT|nr:hypothetical protein [Pyxidicoccus fallax]NMO23087.1 hypothetical protein [Pyxidicoccus fallax]NPC85769.1 hypothetical protein [Pyxidicoccus fallax]
MRPLKIVSSSAVLVALCSLLAGGCGGQPNGNEQAPADPQSSDKLRHMPTSPEQGDDGQGEDGQDPTSGEDGSGNGGGEVDPTKQTLCHIPPGNPANAHTITVGLPAVKAHLKHGDTLGACGTGGEVDAGTGGGIDAGPGGEVDAGTGGEVDAGTGGEVDAGTGGGEVDAGTGTGECAPVGEACGDGVVCCSGLVCSSEGLCDPDIG